MFASLITDAFMGLGCMTFSFALIVLAAFLLALRAGFLPGLSERLKQLWSDSSMKESGREHHGV
jgi:hypothetical protein